MEVVGVGGIPLLRAVRPAKVGSPVAVLCPKSGPHDDDGSVADLAKFGLPKFKIGDVDQRVWIFSINQVVC